MQEKSLAVFESKKIRRYYDAQTETWYFSVIDVVEALTVSINPTDYLKKLRKRDIELGAYIETNCPQVEMVTETGKKRKTLGGICPTYFAARSVHTIAESRTIQAMVGKGGIRTIAGYERPRAFTRPRP